MTKIIKQIYSNEITEAGLSQLREKYPEDLVVDMSDDSEFKAARKTRTERNKLTEAIKRRRLDVTGELKNYGDSLVEQINNIYDVVVLPFEKEDKAKKEKAAEEARKHKELIDSEVKKIKGIYGFVDDCRGKDSKHIQGIIEAVDLIDVDVFHKDVIHEAIEAKKATLHDLAQLLSDTITREKVEAEREELRVKQEEASEKQRQAEKAQQITDRINKLKMTPTELFGQSSENMQKRINSLENFEITEEDFADKIEEVVQAKVIVINQLTKMLENQLKIEAIEQAEADKIKAEEEQKAKDLEEANQATRQAMADKEPQAEEPKQNEAVMQEDPESIERPQEEVNQQAPTPEDVKEFLGWVVSCEDLINDFNYFLLSNDSKLEDEAIDNIKSNFKLYIED